MNKTAIKQLIEARLSEDGMIETCIKGVHLFRATKAIQCAPSVYEPSVTAIVSGNKEAIWEGQKHCYDNQQYICCSMSMPIEAGTPDSSPENPLLGVYISLDTELMAELAIKIDATSGALKASRFVNAPKGLATATWDQSFTDALYRLLTLTDNENDAQILSAGRLRELYYAILMGAAGESARRAFGMGNDIARSIEFLSCHLTDTITIEELADHIGMSRAVYHRKFKQATSMSPIQFIKAMRLNNAAMKIANGINVNVAAMEVGYESPSQFSREFKRLYGQSPKQWRQGYKPPSTSYS